jgi:hypothetical protein
MALVVLLSTAFAHAQAQATPGAQEPVFRAPFDLKLGIDKEHYYQQHFDRIPFVADNHVYLFAGEEFGINVTVVDDQINGVNYQADLSKCDVAFKFWQEKSPDGLMMMLITRNGLKRRLAFDALVTIPQKKGIKSTTVLPVDAGLTNYESWPDPIVQLVLRNFRFSEKASTKQH